MKKLRSIILIVVCVGLCVGYYFYLSHRNDSKDKEPTEIEQLVNKDLEHSYPSTAREVIRLYNRMLLALYGGEISQNEMEELGRQARKLFDEELLLQNPEDSYFLNLAGELKEYEEADKKIISVTVSTSNEVEYREVQGRECAYVESSYYVKGEKESERSIQTYILRKDTEGNWKILGIYQP